MADEFFRPAFRTEYYDGVEALQEDLDAWPAQCNSERPHLGYHNLEKRTIDRIQEGEPR